MSLYDAVLSLADEMDASAETFGNMTIKEVLSSYSRTLRLLAKASGQERSGIASMVYPSPEAQNAREIAKAREEFRANRGKGKNVESREEPSQRMVEAEGGPLDATMVMVPSSMRVDDEFNFNGARYMMGKDGLLHAVVKSS